MTIGARILLSDALHWATMALAAIGVGALLLAAGLPAPVATVGGLGFVGIAEWAWERLWAWMDLEDDDDATP